MLNITNSELETHHLSTRELHKALFESDSLIALMQRAAFTDLRYALENPRYGDITPNAFAAACNKRLGELENRLWEALEQFERGVEADLNLPARDA